jgi:hypothetical protein
LRQKLIDWLRSVWLTRAEPAMVLGPDGREQPNLSAQVVVLTRWDHQDVIGWLLEQELGEAPQHWTVLDLPAIAEDPTEREEKKENNNTRLTKSGEPDKRFKKNKNL